MSAVPHFREVHHVVPEGAERARLDSYLAVHLEPVASRAQASKLAKRGAVLVNGKAAESSRWLHPGDALTVRLLTAPLGPPYRRTVEVAYVDRWLAVVVKPPGLPVRGNQYRTLQHALPHNIPLSDAVDALPAAAPVHRLDSRTSGLVVAARTAGAMVALSAAFAERRVEKRYRAWVSGRLEGEGTIVLPIEGRPAETRYRVFGHAESLHVDGLTGVDLWPATGRTHQLRKHLASLGHPILGDDLYTEGRVLRRQGLFLAALELGFVHPETGDRVHVEIEAPPKFETFPAREQRRWERAQAS